MVAAGVISFIMPKIYEVSMTIEPGIIGVDKNGHFIYLDSPDNIAEKINKGIYNRRIEKALGIDPLKTRVKFDAKARKGAKFVKVTSEWKEGEVGLGKRAMQKLIELISDEYRDIVQQRKGDIDKQIAMKLAEVKKKKDDIKLNEANIKIIRGRESELMQEIKSVENNTKRILQERNNVIKHKGDVDNVSLLLYSVTVQQNIAYANQLRDRLSDLRRQREELETNIEKLNKDIDNINAEIGRLKLKRGIISNIRVIQSPEASIMPVKPKKALNVSVAGVLGFMITVFLSFFLEYIRNAKGKAELED